jgi:D-serine deaminase-like pyridoxal phosphate-dependent protein
MHQRYHIDDPEQILSPSLVVFRDVVEQNIDAVVAMAGGVDRLRPHCKTHKMTEVVRLQLDRGITKHKCATFAEAEMLAAAGVKDVLLSYNIVGPNLARTRAFVDCYPDVAFAVTADDAEMIRRLGEAMGARSVGVLLDVDPGRHRTGIAVGAAARSLYELIDRTSGLRPEGLHLYDGHQRAADPVARTADVKAEWSKVLAFRDKLEEAGLSVPRIVCGGTPTFPVYSKFDDQAIELSPGTFVFHDVGYGDAFSDLSPFTPAAVVLTRVISRPTANRVTFDVGTKAVASDPPMGQRVLLPDVPDAVQVLQNEEHLVVETEQADRWKPGDVTLAIPRHVCPTVALHQYATIVSDGQIVDEWAVAARDRRITI